MSGVADFLKGLVSPVTDLISKAVPDKDLAAQLNQQVTLAILSADTTALQTQGAIITAEAQGESFWQRNWRPFTMLVFVFIVANNYVIAPYAQAIFDKSVSLPTPPDLWALIKLGLGGYVVGRSAEKVTRSLAVGLAAKAGAGS